MRIFIITLILLFVAGLGATASAQGANSTATETTIGFTTVGGLLLLVSAITEGIKNVITFERTIWYQVISWIVSIALSFTGWYFKLGIFESVQLWYYVLLIGIGIGLMSNGFYDIGRIILKYLGYNVGKSLSIKDNSNYFHKNSRGGIGEFRLIYDNGSAIINPTGNRGKTENIKIK